MANGKKIVGLDGRSLTDEYSRCDVAVVVQQGRVVIRLSKQVEWFVMAPAAAALLAHNIMTAARMCGFTRDDMMKLLAGMEKKG